MNVQQLLVFALVALAAVYLARRLWREARGMGNGDCSGCGGACGKPVSKPSGVRSAPEAKPLVTLSVGSRPKPR